MSKRRIKKTKIERVVTYARVSTAEQAAKALSIPAQVRRTKEYASRKGYIVVDTYEEHGASGTSSIRVGKEDCSGHRIPTEKLEEGVLEHIANAVFTEEVCQKIVEDLVEETGVLREKTAIHRKALRKELAEVERRQARWQEAFETGQLREDFDTERVQELKVRKAELEEILSKVVPLRPPPYLYTQANIQRFQADLKDIFLSKKTSMTKNYLKFLVEEIVITDDRVEVSLKPRSALAMMSAEGRKTKSEPPDGDP